MMAFCVKAVSGDDLNARLAVQAESSKRACYSGCGSHLRCWLSPGWRCQFLSTSAKGYRRKASQEPVVESIDLQRVRPPTRSELVGSLLRGDRLYGEVVSSRRPTLAVRSEIGPYRRPSQRYLALPKIIRDATPMKSSFPSTDGASQVRRSEGAGDDNSRGRSIFRFRSRSDWLDASG